MRDEIKAIVEKYNNTDRVEMTNKIKAIAEKYLEFNGKSYRHPQESAVSITEDEGLYMYDYILRNKLKTGFEIGTGTGYSALWLSAALNKFCTMDDYSEGYENIQDGAVCMSMLNELGRKNFVMFTGVSPLDADTAVRASNIDRIDFLFIDGNHKVSSPLMDFRGIYFFLADKATIFWHDYDSKSVKQGMESATREGFSLPLACIIENTYGLAMQTRGDNGS